MIYDALFGEPTDVLVHVARLGKRTLKGNTLTLDNRLNHTVIELTDEQAARWRKYLGSMAFTKRSGGSKRPNNRITGLFKTKKKGLYVGGAKAEQIAILVDKIKQAKAAGVGLTFFLWKSTFEDGPPYSLNVDIEQDASERVTRGKRRIQDDDDEDDGDTSLFGDDDD